MKTLSQEQPRHFSVIALGGAALACSAGYVNSVTLLAVSHLPATHLTGTLSRLGAALAELDTGAGAGLMAATVVTFILGAAISGAVLDSTKLAPGRRYGVLLVLEGLLLGLSALIFVRGEAAGLLPAAMATGMQNAMATQYSGAVVRTTHMTGIGTDLGIALGKALAGRHVEGWRVKLYLGLFGGFFVGAALGAVIFEHLAVMALCVPSALTVAVGAFYWAARSLQLHGVGQERREEV